MMTCRIFVVCISLWLYGLPTVTGQAKTDDYYSDQSLRYTNHVYQKGIETVVLHRTDNVLALPFIDLAANESLTLHFDDLVSESVRSFNYSLIHCNALWEPSGLLEMEYMSGFFQGNITTYDQSFNTKQNYVHYQLTFPGETDMQITLAGNYVVFVYENNDKEKPVLTQRFVAYNQTVNIKYEYKRPTDPEHRNYLQ
ncbi:MAG: type IX secretion system plug protein domain-containing protein, partial [Flavobacteriales bacterium]